MEQFDSSEEASSRVLEQQQRNDEQQCPSCAAELTETSMWTTAANETDCMGWSDQQGSLAVEKRSPDNKVWRVWNWSAAGLAASAGSVTVVQVWFVCGWQVKLCDPLVTHRPYLSATETGHYKALYKLTFFTLYFCFLLYISWMNGDPLLKLIVITH